MVHTQFNKSDDVFCLSPSHFRLNKMLYIRDEFLTNQAVRDCIACFCINNTVKCSWVNKTCGQMPPTLLNQKTVYKDLTRPLTDQDRLSPTEQPSSSPVELLPSTPTTTQATITDEQPATTTTTTTTTTQEPTHGAFVGKVTLNPRKKWSNTDDSVDYDSFTPRYYHYDEPEQDAPDRRYETTQEPDVEDLVPHIPRSAVIDEPETVYEFLARKKASTTTTTTTTRAPRRRASLRPASYTPTTEQTTTSTTPTPPASANNHLTSRLFSSELQNELESMESRLKLIRHLTLQRDNGPIVEASSQMSDLGTTINRSIERYWHTDALANLCLFLCLLVAIWAVVVILKTIMYCIWELIKTKQQKMLAASSSATASTTMGPRPPPRPMRTMFDVEFDV